MSSETLIQAAGVACEFVYAYPIVQTRFSILNERTLKKKLAKTALVNQNEQLIKKVVPLKLDNQQTYLSSPQICNGRVHLLLLPENYHIKGMTW